MLGLLANYIHSGQCVQSASAVGTGLLANHIHRLTVAQPASAVGSLLIIFTAGNAWVGTGLLANHIHRLTVTQPASAVGTGWAPVMTFIAQVELPSYHMP